MSHPLINHSPDLKRLRDEGFDLEVRSGFLLVKGVPYVNGAKEVKRGTIVSELTLAGDVTTKPGTHVAFFAGEYPCDKNGAELAKIRRGSGHEQLAKDVVVQHSFSAKPLNGGYADYYEKITTYVALLSGPAEVIEPGVTARTFPVIPAETGDSVFHYIDTASSRAGIANVNAKLELQRIAIVGLGGTGSYVLDLVVKTPVKEIHLFDGDVLLQHNAFRAPGAASLEDLKQVPKKAAYWTARYSVMREGIKPHDYHVDASTVDELRVMQFVFLCIDGGTGKHPIMETLEEFGVPFIDVGMGVQVVDNCLLGVLRVTSSTVKKREHVKKRVSFHDGGNDDYEKNIQIADLNALNAALAVIKWKKLFGFYLDLEQEHSSTYTIDGNTLTNEDRA